MSTSYKEEGGVDTRHIECAIKIRAQLHRAHVRSDELRRQRIRQAVKRAIDQVRSLEEAFTLAHFIAISDQELVTLLAEYMVKFAPTHELLQRVMRYTRSCRVPTGQNPVWHEWIRRSHQDVESAEDMSVVRRAWRNAPGWYDIGSPKYRAVEKAIAFANSSDLLRKVMQSMIPEGRMCADYTRNLTELAQGRMREHTSLKAA